MQDGDPLDPVERRAAEAAGVAAAMAVILGLDEATARARIVEARDAVLLRFGAWSDSFSAGVAESQRVLADYLRRKRGGA